MERKFNRLGKTRGMGWKRLVAGIFLTTTLLLRCSTRLFIFFWVKHFSCDPHNSGFDRVTPFSDNFEWSGSAFQICVQFLGLLTRVCWRCLFDQWIQKRNYEHHQFVGTHPFCRIHFVVFPDSRIFTVVMELQLLKERTTQSIKVQKSTSRTKMAGWNSENRLTKNIRGGFEFQRVCSQRIPDQQRITPSLLWTMWIRAKWDQTSFLNESMMSLNSEFQNSQLIRIHSKIN